MSSSTSTAPASLTQLIDLAGRTAVVTGGAMGIGRAIASRLHEAGANIVLADRDDAVATVAAGIAGERTDAVVGLHADVADPRDAARMTTCAVEHFGSIDILVNNAGIYPNCPFLDMEPTLFRRVVDVNLAGVFHCTQSAARRMVEQGRGGRIINITSIDALHPSMVGLAHYDASKHGVWGFTKNIALELAPHGIWVNALAPGGVATPGAGDVDEETSAAFAQTIPMRRMADPDDIARMVVVLASDLASYMTGAQIVVDGGKLLT